MRKFLFFAACLSVAACNSSPPRATAQAGTHEREVRDSILGKSKIPGAKAVDRALDVQAESRKRAAAMDSVLQ